MSPPQVLDAFVRQTDALVDLYVDGEVISTTGEDPFWTPDKGWVEAKHLQVGSLLETEDGRIIDVDGIEKRSGQFEVYNFKVEGWHTYFVSDLGVLVHNAGCGPTDDMWMSWMNSTEVSIHHRKQHKSLGGMRGLIIDLTFQNCQVQKI